MLQVNRTTTATITRGAPVFVTVTLISRASDTWTRQLRLETADGSPFAYRLEPLGDAVRLGAPDAPIQSAELGISPDEAARIAGATYNIRAAVVLDGRAGAGPLLSNTVTLIVQEGQAAAAAEAAQFNLLAGKWEEAHRLAARLVERQDADAAAFILLADALNGLQRDEEAIAAYHQALALLPKDLKESPDYVFARMQQIQQRLDAAAGKKEVP